MVGPNHNALLSGDCDRRCQKYSIATLQPLLAALCIGCAALSAPADEQIAAGVRITAADHQRITSQIRDSTGIEISSWVWERYMEGIEHLEHAKGALFKWISSLPRELVHGNRPVDMPVNTIWERSENLFKRASEQFDAGLLSLEEAYFAGLTLHQVPRDLVTELRHELYRRQLLSRNDIFPGADLDVVQLLRTLPLEITDDVTLQRVEAVERAYTAEVLHLLLSKVTAQKEINATAATMFDLLHGPPREEPPEIDKAKQRTKTRALEGAIALKNAAYVQKFADVLPGHLGTQLVQTWRQALYPFLWNPSLTSALIRLLASDEVRGESLADETRLYQDSMHQQLWHVQIRLADPDNLIQGYLDPSTSVWHEFTTLKNSCIAQMKEYADAVRELNATRGSK